jgi:hypothetical protein
MEYEILFKKGIQMPQSQPPLSFSPKIIGKGKSEIIISQDLQATFLELLKARFSVEAKETSYSQLGLKSFKNILLPSGRVHVGKDLETIKSGTYQFCKILGIFRTNTEQEIIFVQFYLVVDKNHSIFHCPYIKESDSFALIPVKLAKREIQVIPDVSDTCYGFVFSNLTSTSFNFENILSQLDE